MKELIINHKMTIIGILIGALAGYAYYYFVGCASGTCSITSDPTNSTLYGAVMGGLLFTSYKKEKQESIINKINPNEQ